MTVSSARSIVRTLFRAFGGCILVPVLAALIVGSVSLAKAIFCRPEPIGDVVVMLVIVMVILSAAALAAFACHLVIVVRGERIGRPASYMLSGAFGSGALLSFAGASQALGVPGLVWQYPLIGGAMGALYGVLYWWLVARS